MNRKELISTQSFKKLIKFGSKVIKMEFDSKIYKKYSNRFKFEFIKMEWICLKSYKNWMNSTEKFKQKNEFDKKNKWIRLKLRKNWTWLKNKKKNKIEFDSKFIKIEQNST